MKRKIVIILAFATLTSHVLFAKGISISPVKIEFGRKTNTAQLSIGNGDDKDRTFHAYIKKWEQDENSQEIYSDTRDIIPSPPIFLVKKGSKQIIRLMLLKPGEGNNEEAYRIYIEEIKNPTKIVEGAPKVATLSMVFKIGIPIFITPINSIKEKYQWVLNKKGEEELQVAFNNLANTHARFDKLEIINHSNKKTLFNLSGNKTILPFKKYVNSLKINAKEKPESIDILSIINGKNNEVNLLIK
jgi:P pilus assembly chaperone PapD